MQTSMVPSAPAHSASDAAAAQDARIWLLLSDKLGDNAQINTVAAALGLPCLRKHLFFKRRFARLRPAFEPSLRHVDIGRSDALAAPWPDLIIVSGRRPGAVALWIKRASGGRTKIVIIGRPHRHLAAFDLVIAPPQFALPARPNILALTAPLFALDAGAVAEQARQWAPRFADLPRPLTAILLGGPQPPFRFDSAVARAIVAHAARQAGSGTLLILTSRRTPPAVVDALRQALPANARLFAWNEKKGTDKKGNEKAHGDRAANPYRAVLGLADRFIVSGDSISMIGEVLALGKALAIAPAPLRQAPHILLEQAVARRFRAAPASGRGFWSRLKRYCHDRGILPFARDFAAFHDSLIRRGMAVRLGTSFRQPAAPDTTDVAAVSARIRALLGETAELPRR
ncbi:MAG TPA: ELM1/GtrOC1 family putative glycosyltransferase [Dongiaceae bacterium]|nr:ELM1/GtrOC1 family putative glycosyltransferase [Dongiaceae bacterium]